MRLSPSSELVHQLAAREAIAGRFKEIEPDHFCLALMKFSELPLDEMEKMGQGGGIARVLANEVKSLREEFESRAVDVKRMRRDLRERLGKGDSTYDGGQLHRSQASRDMFKVAEGFAQHAGSETLTAVHFLEALLTAPTKAMRDVLGDAVRTRPKEVPEKPQDDIPWEL